MIAINNKYEQILMMYLNDDVLYNIFRIMSFVLYHELISTSSSVFNFFFSTSISNLLCTIFIAHSIPKCIARHFSFIFFNKRKLTYRTVNIRIPYKKTLENKFST